MACYSCFTKGRGQKFHITLEPVRTFSPQREATGLFLEIIFKGLVNGKEVGCNLFEVDVLNHVVAIFKCDQQQKKFFQGSKIFIRLLNSLVFNSLFIYKLDYFKLNFQIPYKSIIKIVFLHWFSLPICHDRIGVN